MSASWSILLFGLAILVAAMTYVPGASAWAWLRMNVLFGVFGVSTYLLAPALVYLAILVAMGRPARLKMAFGALVMCACMAFIVTTADSYLLSSATNLTNDIYVKYIRKDATDKQKMLVLRGTIIVFSFIAVALTLYFPTVLSLQMTAYTMYGAAITPAILFALFSKKVTPAGGMAGILVGGLVTIIWTLMGTPYGIQCAIVAVPASVIAILIVSAVTRCNDPKRSLEALYQDN